MPSQSNSESDSANRYSFVRARSVLPPDVFRTHLKKLMAMNGIKQKDLVKRLVIPQPTLSDYLAGKRNRKIDKSAQMGSDRMVALAEYMDELAEEVGYIVAPISRVPGIELEEEETEEEKSHVSSVAKPHWTERLIGRVLKEIEDPEEREAYGKFLRTVEPADLSRIYLVVTDSDSGSEG